MLTAPILQLHNWLWMKAASPVSLEPSIQSSNHRPGRHSKIIQNNSGQNKGVSRFNLKSCHSDTPYSQTPKYFWWNIPTYNYTALFSNLQHRQSKASPALEQILHSSPCSSDF